MNEFNVVVIPAQIALMLKSWRGNYDAVLDVNELASILSPQDVIFYFSAQDTIPKRGAVNIVDSQASLITMIAALADGFARQVDVSPKWTAWLDANAEDITTARIINPINMETLARSTALNNIPNDVEPTVSIRPELIGESTIALIVSLVDPSEVVSYSALMTRATGQMVGVLHKCMSFNAIAQKPVFRNYVESAGSQIQYSRRVASAGAR